MSLGIMPHMVGMAGTAADSFVGVETPITKAVAGRRRQTAQGDEGSLKEPVRQGRVVPGLVPESCHLIQTIRFLGERLGYLRSIFESFPILKARLRPPHGFDGVGEMPSDHKRRSSGRPRGEVHCLGHSADQRLTDRRSR